MDLWNMSFRKDLESQRVTLIPRDIGILWHWKLNVWSENFPQNSNTNNYEGSKKVVLFSKLRLERKRLDLIYSNSNYYTKYRQTIFGVNLILFKIFK